MQRVILAMMLVCGSLFTAPVHAAILPCTTSTGFVDKLVLDPKTSDTYSSAIVMGHLTQTSNNFICVNGLKITANAGTIIENGNRRLSRLGELPAKAVVEIEATPDKTTGSLLARRIQLQYTIAGYMKFQSSMLSLNIMGDTIKGNNPAPNSITNTLMPLFVSGIRHNDSEQKITPLFVQYGWVEREQGAPITRLTGTLIKRFRNDTIGNRSYRYYIGNTMIRSHDESKLEAYVDKHVIVKGIWTKGMEDSYLDSDEVSESPFTKAYQIPSSPTYISLEHYLLQNDDIHTTLLDFSVGADALTKFFADNPVLTTGKDRLVIGTGVIRADGTISIDHLAPSLLPDTTYSRIEHGTPKL